MKKTDLSLKSIWLSPLMKIIICGLACILLPILINKLILESLFQFIGFNENLSRAIRAIISAFILMPLLYHYVLTKFYKQKPFDIKALNPWSGVFWFAVSVLFIGLVYFIFILLGFIQVTEFISPKLLLVNGILIMSMVIIEEIFFRGIFYNIIEGRWGTLVALLTSSILFGVMHLPNENTSIASFLSAISGGIVLGILYTYTKNLLAPITFHFGWNLTQVLLGYGLSGGNEFADSYLLKFKTSGSDIITGGVSGIENSILVSILLFILFLILFKMSRQARLLVPAKKDA
ncbi:MAG: CPBP family intramembrane metalloprotease [Bacteroidetes bacterium]|nr:CPBP family intramembrane metalloprotease [Bacteroidota bacterium]